MTLPDDDKRYAEVADHIRELIVYMHNGRATAEQIDEIKAHLRAAADLATTFPPERTREIESPEIGGDADGQFRSTSPVSGRANPIAPPMIYDESATTDRRMAGKVRFGAPYEGPPGHAHGGWIAAVLDEMLGRAQRLAGQMGMTGSLEIRYQAPSPLFKELTVEATFEKAEGRKVTVTGALKDGDKVCATAKGIFIKVDFDTLRSRLPGR